jgi:hypothetical protein
VSVCAHCGFEFEVGTDSCPLCGALAVGGVAEGARDPGATAGPPVAWEDPSVPFPANFVRSYGAIIRAPKRFFARVPFDNPVARPLLFYLIIVIVAAFFSLLVTASIGVPEGFEEAFGGYDLGIEMGEGELALVAFFATPFVLLFGLLINSLVIHLFVALLIRERRTLGATTRVLCYAVAPYPVAAIPLIGPLVSMIWITVLVIFGLREAHRTTTGRAAAAVLMPMAMLTIMVVLYLIFVFAVFMSMVDPV